MKIKLPPITIAFLVCLFSLTQLNTSSASDTKIQLKNTYLGSIPEGHEILSPSIRYSPDFYHVSYVTYTDINHNFVHLDNKISTSHRAVRPGFPVFSSKTNRNAYIAYQMNDKAFCVVDWEKGPDYDNVDEFLFSTDGTRYAYRAQIKDKQCIVLDGQPGPLFHGIPVKKNMIFSLNSKKIAYVAYDKNFCFLVLNGIQQKENYGFIEDVTFSYDSEHVAYKGRISKTATSEEWQVVVDGTPGPVYNQIYDLIYSFDSKQFTYAALKGKKMVVVIDGQEQPPQDVYGYPLFSGNSKSLTYIYVKNNIYHVVINGNEEKYTFDRFYKFFYSYDSSKFAYIALDGDSWYCVVNGQKDPGVKALDSFKFSPDSSQYAYSAISEDKQGFIVHNGNPHNVYPSIGEPYFSPDSKHVVYKAVIEKKNQWTTIINGKPQKLFYATIGKYFFSHDSKHYAYSGMKKINNIIMVVDGHEQTPDQSFKIISDPYFSPEGKHVAYYTMTQNERWNLVVDNHMIDETYTGFMNTTPIIYDSENSFHTLGFKNPGPKFILIEVAIPENYKIETQMKF